LPFPLSSVEGGGVLFATLLLMKETEDNATLTEQTKSNLALSLKFYLKKNFSFYRKRDPQGQNLKRTSRLSLWLLLSHKKEVVVNSSNGTTGFLGLVTSQSCRGRIILFPHEQEGVRTRVGA